MEWYEAEVRELEAARSRRQLPEHPVVFYGSSSIRLWESLGDDFRTRRILNLGFGGSTLEACAYFFERVVVPVAPCSLVVYAGDNDLGDGRSPQEVLASFRALAAKVDRYLGGIEFGFVSIKPSPGRFHLMDRIRMANRLIRGEIEVRRRGYFMDVFDAMLDREGKPRRSLYHDDGLHLSLAGYGLWVELLTPYLHRILTTDCSSVKTTGLHSGSEARVPPMVQPKPRA